MESDYILVGLKHRDEVALSTLFDMYYEKLYLFAEKYIYDSDRAHDIVQDVFLKIWENAERLELKSSIQHYLFTSVRNGCLNYLKSLQIEDRNNRKYVEAYIESQNVDMVEDEDLLAKIRQVLDELPDRCREVCLLRFVEGYKYNEIAVALKMNEKWEKKTFEGEKAAQYGNWYYQVTSDSPWNYALTHKSLEPDQINDNFVVEKTKVTTDYPWNIENAPITIKAKGKRLNGWSLYRGSSGSISYFTQQGNDMGDEESIELIPYGCTTLRITEFPVR